MASLEAQPRLLAAALAEAGSGRAAAEARKVALAAAAGAFSGWW